MRQLLDLIVFLSYYCRMTEYMAHFVDSAHWLLEQCIVGKLQHQFYDTDNFLFLISYCPNHFLTFVLCYPCRMLHYIQSVPLCHVIFHHVYVYMCDHLKNKSPVVQYFAMFASPDYYSNLCIHKVLLKIASNSLFSLLNRRNWLHKQHF